MPDEPTAVQPAPGQGDAGGDSAGLYDLSTAPEELRPYLESELKKVEANVTRRFQEHADFRKKFEPLSELGVADIPAEELQELIQFRQLASDPEQFSQWWESVGEHLGFFEQESPQEADADAGGNEPDMAASIAAQVMEQLEGRLAPLEDSFRSQEQEQRLQQATDEIASELEALKTQHGDFDDDAVCQLALAYEGRDAIRKGFEDYQRIVGATERGMVEDKLRQPDPAESGGKPSADIEPVTSFGDARKLAMERLRGAA